MSKKTCPKCGKEINIKGYYAHHKFCKGTLQQSVPTPAMDLADELGVGIEELINEPITWGEETKQTEAVPEEETQIMREASQAEQPPPELPPPYIPMEICPKEIAYFPAGKLIFLSVAGRWDGAGRFVIDPTMIKVR